MTCINNNLTSLSRGLRQLQKIQPHRDLNSPQAKKDQLVCKKIFENFKTFDQKTLYSKKGMKYARSFVEESHRLGKPYGGKDRRAKPDLKALEFLKAEGLKYKKIPIRFRDEKDFLTEEQLAQLEELAHYPDYVALCKKNPALLDNVFNWSLLNRLSVRVWAEFPQVTALIDKSLLKGRHSTDPNCLKFHEKKGIKDVRMTFEGKEVSILNPKKKVTLAKGDVKTIGDIFKEFQKKNTIEGHLTFFPGKGITNFDSMEYGSYNPKTKKVECIDFQRPNWYQQLPMKAHLTAKEATEKFGVPCDGKNYVMTVVAACQSTRLDIDISHSFVRLAIPREDGTYDYTYGFGIFAKKYPQNFLHALGYLFAPKPAAIQYPDNNEIYTHRYLKEVHFSLTPKKGAACVDSWKNDILKSQTGEILFHYLIRNCTDRTAEMLKEYVGEKESRMFDVLPYLKLQPTGFLGCLLKILRKTPDWFRRLIFNIFAFIFCGWNTRKFTREDGTKETMSIFKTPAWDLKRPFRHPGVVFLNQS